MLIYLSKGEDDKDGGYYDDSDEGNGVDNECDNVL